MLGNDGVLIYPTHPVPAPYHNEPLVKPFNFSYTGIFNVLGLPATHCPLGLSSHGLPVGVQVINDQIIIADGTDQWHFDYINRLCLELRQPVHLYLYLNRLYLNLRRSVCNIKS